MVTVEPSSTFVPAGGSVRVTFPVSMVDDGSVFRVVLKRARANWLAASGVSWLGTSGMVFWALPLDTVSVTVEPFGALRLASGSCLSTVFFGVLGSTWSWMLTLK